MRVCSIYYARNDFVYSKREHLKVNCLNELLYKRLYELQDERLRLNEL